VGDEVMIGFDFDRPENLLVEKVSEPS